MRIAIVIEKFDPSGGGNERSTDQIARGLIARGHAVTILAGRTASSAGPLLPECGTVLTCPGRSGTRHALGLVRFVRWAERQIATGGYDASISMTTAVPAAVVQPRGGTVRETLGRNLAMRRTTLSHVIKKASIGLSPKQLTLLAAEHRTFNHSGVKVIIAISQYVADQLFHYYAVPSRRVEYIPNAAEITRRNPVDQQILRRRMRSGLALEPTDVAFLFSARNPSLKGLPYLLDAFARVSNQRPEARLIVAGVLDHRAIKPLQRLGIAEKVRWIGPTRQTDALYAAADVTVLPSWYDPSSKVVLESLLHGVPAISTLYNGASQWILSPSGRVRIPSPFEAGKGATISGDAQPAGRVIREPHDLAGLAAAMLEMCDKDVRRRCSIATVGLNQKISMNTHVDKLQAVLAGVAEQADPDLAPGAVIDHAATE